MAIEQSMADAILGTFRTMAQGLANNKSEAADTCRAVLERMEALAREMSDMAEFSTKLAVDNLYTDFSTSYGAALSQAAASSSQSTGGDPDAYLLEQSLKAYEDSLNELKKNPSHAHVVPVVARVVELAKSGMTYPNFLKTCEEEGVFLGLESPHAEPSIKYQIYCSKKSFLKLETEMYEEELKAFQKLVAKSAFGYPDPVEWEMVSRKIEWDFAPRIAKWKAISDRWDKMLDMVHDWLDSFCNFAPTDERWVSLNGMAETKENIARCQETYPGEIVIREEIFTRYFGLTWDNIFTHETFLHALTTKTIWYSDELISLLKEAKKEMLPGQKPSSQLIAKAESIHQGKRFIRSDMPTSEQRAIVSFPEFLATQ